MHSILMMKNSIASYITLLVLLSSCKAFKTLAVRDNSAATASTSDNNKKSIAFLDDISVTPGSPGTKGGETYITGNKVAKNNTPEPAHTVHNIAVNNNTTNVAVLQLKYAALLDVSADKLTNIALLQDIDHWWGTKYCMGGETEDCIDCSGFTKTILIDVYGITIPRVAQAQYDSSAHIDNASLTEGDLVFFHTSGRGKSITHVGVYITNNRFAHASTTGGVTIGDLNDPYWQQRYRGAGRIKRT